MLIIGDLEAKSGKTWKVNTDMMFRVVNIKEIYFASPSL